MSAHAVAPGASAPAPAGGSALSPASVGGRRRRVKSAKKLRVVKKKTVRKMLAKKGLRMRGGEAGAAGVPETSGVAPDGSLAAPADGEAVAGGRRRSRKGRKGRKGTRRSRKLFGMF